MTLLDGFDLPALAQELGALGADGWLLYDFRKLTRLLAASSGTPAWERGACSSCCRARAVRSRVAHRIELQALADFPGEVRPYGACASSRAPRGPGPRRTLAIETSPRDQVPYLDRVPHGVVQLLESFGARLVSSAPLVSRFAARWSPAELAGHRKAAEVLAASRATR